MYRSKVIIIKFLILTIMLLSTSPLVYANENIFNSPYFNITLMDNLKLISKNEDSHNGFYRYIFSSSDKEDGTLQMRVIVSSKQPQQNQSLEDFQMDAVANMSVMFMDSYKLYEYLKTPENKKVLEGKPDKLKLGDANYTGVTMYFGNIDASFLVTNVNNMTYAFTLISKDENQQVRRDNLKKLTEQLQSIQFIKQ